MPYRAQAPTTTDPVPPGPFADLADHFTVQRRDGVLLLRMHTGGGPALYSLGLHRAWSRAWHAVATDPATEVVIITGTGQSWLGGVDTGEELFTRPLRDWPPETVDALHRDRVRMLESLVFGVDVPTIGVINGPGFHVELALFCDLTLCTPDATLFDGHFAAGEVPGDGMHLALRALLGDKRAAFHIYTGTPIDAADAARLGLVNEVVPAGEAVARAWELAALLMRQPPAVRRHTHALVQRGMRRSLFDDHGVAVSSALFSALTGRRQGGADA